jgi:hypothetical protein
MRDFLPFVGNIPVISTKDSEMTSNSSCCYSTLGQAKIAPWLISSLSEDLIALPRAAA